ncbi:hypothetical protein SAMN02799630_01205 [Paenibacillus sp. UNCCL117]|uniref:hypothetical protein n=1 Tax=unclassified Paenibacillus TaxID=185978 RepID=UPI00088D2618|nr:MULTISPECIES: hypothetical protein [unclassified Paenibacillus]SDC69439.1 hypothetical protein SAMN04488602_103183 [Paenibacillus sp. cl123]SFW23925.1 hypothetical protein SAMN02799630_01205 [Paenibacillus sp. UNCCL117]
MNKLTDGQARVYEALRVAADKTTRGISEALDIDIGVARNILLTLERKGMATSSKIRTREGNQKEFAFIETEYEVVGNNQVLGKQPAVAIIDLPPAEEVELTPEQWQFLRDNKRWWRYRTVLAKEMGLPKYVFNNALEKLRKQMEREKSQDKKARKRA